MNDLEDLAYQIDPALWVEHKLNIVPQDWQKQLLRARRGASIIVLTARQVGKTTAAAWAIAHMMLFSPGSLSVVACPTQRQSAEAVRRVKDVLAGLGAKMKVENVYGLELDNGSRVLALPGSDDSIRGLTVDGWIVADEAARLSEDLIAALHPMRARRPEARLVMLSTAWSRTDPFWNVWAGDDPSWIRIQATADQIGLYSAAYLDQQRRTLGDTAFNKEYLGIPGGASVSPFDWPLYQRAAQVHIPLSSAGSIVPIPPAETILHPHPLFRPMRYDPNDVRSWGRFCPPILVHDVARSRDRSTAVIGGNCPVGPRRFGIGFAEELPQNLMGAARASALAAIDRKFGSQSLIVVDISNDETYAELLLEAVGERVIGLHISRFGNGMHPETRVCRHGRLPVYTVGRTILLELLHREFLSDAVRLIDTPQSARPMNSLPILRWNTGRGVRSTPVHQANMTISPYPSPCSRWPRNIPIFQCGSTTLKERKDHGQDARHPSAGRRLLKATNSHWPAAAVLVTLEGSMRLQNCTAARFVRRRARLQALGRELCGVVCICPHRASR